MIMEGPDGALVNMVSGCAKGVRREGRWELYIRVEFELEDMAAVTDVLTVSSWPSDNRTGSAEAEDIDLVGGGWDKIVEFKFKTPCHTLWLFGHTIYRS